MKFTVLTYELIIVAVCCHSCMDANQRDPIYCPTSICSVMKQRELVGLWHLIPFCKSRKTAVPAALNDLCDSAGPSISIDLQETRILTILACKSSTYPGGPFLGGAYF